MKVFYPFWLLVLTVFFSALISSFSLQMIGGTGFVLYFAVIACMTVVFGVPCSLVIRLLIRRNDIRGHVLKGVLHVAAGFSVPLFFFGNQLLEWSAGDWAEYMFSIFPIMYAAHAGIFYGVHVYMRSLLGIGGPMWEEEQEESNNNPLPAK